MEALSGWINRVVLPEKEFLLVLGVASDPEA
jgi:hypothetical protein